jgi:hypothetical protein
MRYLRRLVLVRVVDLRPLPVGALDVVVGGLGRQMQQRVQLPVRAPVAVPLQRLHGGSAPAIPTPSLATATQFNPGPYSSPLLARVRPERGQKNKGVNMNANADGEAKTWRSRGMARETVAELFEPCPRPRGAEHGERDSTPEWRSCTR